MVVGILCVFYYSDFRLCCQTVFKCGSPCRFAPRDDSTREHFVHRHCEEAQRADVAIRSFYLVRLITQVRLTAAPRRRMLPHRYSHTSRMMREANEP